MVADALFEDFSTADFANRKRSISVNQNLHKTNPYVARLSKEEYGNMRLTFSRGYSSFGQATIDMHIEQKKNVLLYRQVNDMLRVFFGVSADDIKTNTPTDKDRDEILSTRMYLRLENEIINNIFVVNDESFKKGVERTTYALVKELLRVKGISRLDDIDKQITERFEEIRTGGNFKGWRDKIAEAIADINRDTFKGIESGTGLHEELVRRRRQELLADLLDGQKENSFIRALWSRVDNKERGGLDYTIQLVHSIKDKLENNEVGIIKILKDNAKWFSDLSGFLRTKETDSLMEHLDQAFRKIIGAHIQSEMKLKQIADVVKLYVRYHMISIASREAAKLVEEFADRLARQVGTDENGMPIWTGFVGELEEGRRLVKNIIGDLDKQINLTQEAMRQSHAMYFGLSGAANSIDKVDLVSPVKAQQWAEDAFKDFGGTQNLFSMLQDEEGRVDLITKLQNRAMELISEQSEQNVENPLFSALDAQLNLGQLGQTFSDFLNMAMPWVSARIDGYLKELDPNDQYKCYIGVKDSVRFESKYGALLKSRLPTSTMITSQEIKFVEIDTPGKVVCYTELSGLPLPALTGLNEWYTSYREENDKTPVHTHRSTSTFVHPRELTTDELASRAADFKIFIQAVATGLLTRVQKGEEKGLYKVWIRGHAKYVGDEKCLRMEGFTTTYRDEVSRRLELDIDQLQSSDQVGLWVALLEYYSNSVYPLRDLILDRKTVDQKSLPTLVCEQLVTDWKTRFNRMLGSAHAENILQRARAALDKWSDIVPDSRNDVYHYEINEKDAMPKRALKREVFKLDWKLDGGGTVFSCYVALDGKAEGPYELDKLRELARKGALTELTKVWKNGMADWGFAKDFDELSGLLVQPSPIVPPPLHNVPPPLGGNV
jgi:AraC-like DNA-binding protein